VKGNSDILGVLSKLCKEETQACPSEEVLTSFLHSFQMVASVDAQLQPPPIADVRSCSPLPSVASVRLLKRAYYIRSSRSIVYRIDLQKQ
jgi:hypothetical protein